MGLSAPVHILKKQAKDLKKTKSVTMVAALNEIAYREGFSSWSLLQSKADQILPNSYVEILNYFKPGDLILVGARPGMRKTTFCIGLFVQAIKNKSAKNFFFSLSEVHKSIAKRIARYDENIEQDSSRYEHDYSNEICANYVINKISSEVTTNSLIVIDYLQLLDQKRTNDTLQNQVVALKNFARAKGCIIIFISQVDRIVENRLDPRPTISDILLPNPLDLGLMNKILLLYIDLNKQEEADIIFCKPKLHKFKYPLKKGEIKFS